MAIRAVRKGSRREWHFVPVNPERRALLRADLDAAFLHVYGLNREEAEHVLDSFTVGASTTTGLRRVPNMKIAGIERVRASSACAPPGLPEVCHGTLVWGPRFHRDRAQPAVGDRSDVRGNLRRHRLCVLHH
jgi:hypothetical protein